MKKFLLKLVLPAFIITMVLIACRKETGKNSETALELSATTNSMVTTLAEEACGTPLVKDLEDMGGVYSWGSVVVSNDDNNITVKVNSVHEGMFITKVTLVYGSQQHVTDYLAKDYNWTPCHGPALFDRQKTFAMGTTTMDTIRIANSNFQPDNCIWLSVNVELVGEFGTLGCGYASPYDGELIGSAQWQSAFRYCRQACPPPPPPGDCGQLRTQTPGGWGAPPNGNNPGVYLHNNFAAAFPGGLTIGCYPGDHYVMLSSAQAITSYLPAGGKPSVLTGNYIDPATKALKNTLVNHLVALTLSTGFDAYDAGFGEAGILLGDMQIGSGKFAGWTVSNFLAEANKVLGGCSTDYSVNEVLETASAINENYVDGKKDNGYLVCPQS